ncbi:hypothetical protein VTJ49DRAFT_1026 [Mycothermus thermophilus]|uniref:CENP-V/GFA domain-containing protein n=1 Tax=Humicola insolens TaxID=85995 RepID=A0ABR3VEQ0_HUMIN
MSTDLHLPHQLPGHDKTLRAACHCGSVDFTVTVPTSALPLPVHLCHCSICRYLHGTLSCFHADLPKGIQPEFVPPSSLASSRTGYIHAQAVSERLFCTTCGCHIGDRSLKPDPETGMPHWCVASSIFTTHDEDTFQIRSHWYSSPATEPNLATWLPAINSRPIHFWNPPAAAASRDAAPQGEGEEEEPSHRRQPGPDNDENADKALLAQCLCTGVTFSILPPTKEEAADPFLSQFLQPDPAAKESESTSSPSRSLKRSAGICLCRDCRLVSGAHAVAWMFVPLGRLRPGGGTGGGVEEGREEQEQQQRGDDDKFGLSQFGRTLRTYHSSPGVTRGFCGVCGATVFYAMDSPERIPPPLPTSRADAGADAEEEKKRVLVDVAVGILRDPSGSVAAENWLVWQTRCEGMETGRAFDRGFAEGLERGLGEWGEKRYGRRVEFEIT